MDGACRSLGRPVLFEPGCGCASGAHLLRPMTLGVLASCESFLLLKRVTLAERADAVADCLDLSDDGRNELRWRARDEIRKDRAHRIVTMGELSRWLYTREGAAHSLFWCFRGSRCPQAAGLRQAAAFWASMPSARRRAFFRARDHASGIDLLANLDWPPRPDEGEKPSGKPRYHPWKRVVRFLCHEYRLDPDKVARLTLYSLHIFQCEESELGGKMTVGMGGLPASAFAGGKRPPDPRRRGGRGPAETE